MTQNTIPWQEMMGAAHELLSLPPDLFWQLTVPEWRSLIAHYRLGDHDMFNKDQLRALMQHFPDEQP